MTSRFGLMLSSVATIIGLILIGAHLSFGQTKGDNVRDHKLSNYPESIRANLTAPNVNVFGGVVNSILIQPPSLSVDIYNQQQQTNMGFVVNDTTDKKQEYIVKSLFAVFEHNKQVNVYYNQDGTIRAVVVY